MLFSKFLMVDVQEAFYLSSIQSSEVLKKIGGVTGDF